MRVCKFSHTPEEHYTRVVSSVSWVFMLKKSTALEWLALYFVNCVLGVGSTPTYLTDFCRLDDVHCLATWFPSLLWFFLNLEQFWLICEHGLRKRTYAGFVIFLYLNWMWQKLITMKWFRAVWLCPSFCCRNHTILCMSRVWHQPSQVEKAYDCFFNVGTVSGPQNLCLITLVLL
jgi:hypothetical protein